MNETETERLNESYRKFAEGDRAEALRELQELAKSITEPWRKSALLYHEALFLVEMERVSEARRCLEEFKRTLASLDKPPRDSYEDDLPHNLALMSRYTEVRVLLAESKESEALQILDELALVYPRQLSLAGFEDIAKELETYRALLLGDAGRWFEAKPLLENAAPPEAWRGIVSYYLGHCYYVLQDYDRAQFQLIKAMSLSLGDKWQGRAHYIRGLVEYHLGNLAEAKRQLELSVKTATPEYLTTTRVWEWLEAISRSLGQYAEAKQYRPRTIDPDSTAN